VNLNSTQLCIYLALLSTALVFTNCATPLPKPIDPQIGYVEEGIASWYGPGFHGKPTASGERYNMYQMTGAHKRLPLGTIVQVQSLTTGLSATVRINDRGPFVRGRIIDLSYAAARSLRMIGKGIEKVRVKVLEKPYPSGSFWVQVSAFDDLKEARTLGRELKEDFGKVRIVSVKLSTGRWYRVQVGEFPTEKRANKAAKKIKAYWGVNPLVLGP
jgi:rare lipoprotein A